MMTSNLPAFIFVHGAWHDQHSWDAVLPLLHDQGYVAEALDLPGAAAGMGNPQSFFKRPLDLAAFATEPSPVAGITQDERNTALLAKIDAVAARTGGKVIVVAHSLGGVTLTPVAEAHPEKLTAAVYLTASYFTTGQSTFSFSQTPEMVGTQSGLLLLADPGVIGGVRLDVASTDPEYRERFKSVFAGDLDDASFEQTRLHMHTDEPVSVFATPSAISAEHFGMVPRHYIQTTRDGNIPLAAQQGMIASVDAEVGSVTQRHTLHTSHSPFYSNPRGLSDLLTGIARQHG